MSEYIITIETLGLSNSINKLKIHKVLYRYSILIIYYLRYIASILKISL